MSNTIISSRIRFARNLAGTPFATAMTSEHSRQICDMVRSALGRIDGDFVTYSMSQLSELDAAYLRERHLISDALIANHNHAAVAIGCDEQVSIMINEEDHIRAQCILPHDQLTGAYQKLSRIDQQLASALPYAVHPQFGYLTSCITNVGTGMRASAMMFLPGLCITNSIQSSISIAGNFKLAIRGIYGEGSDNEGYLYQISNQQTLGITETEILGNVVNIIAHLERAEQSARERLLATNPVKLRDEVGRAFGILTNAYSLSRREFMGFLALVRLGAGLQLLDIDSQVLDNMLAECSDAYIAKHSRSPINQANIDIARAQKSREILTK